jgi:hypothetical protein
MLIALLLSLQAAVGQSTTVTVESSLDLDVLVRDGLGENRRVLSLVRREKFSQEVLEIAEGRAKSVRIKVLGSTLQRSGTDLPIEEKPTALVGQTFTAAKSGDGWMARDKTGGAPPIEAVHLGAWNEASRLFPKEGAPKAGDAWKADGRDFLPLLYPMGLGEAAGQLDVTCEAADANKITVAFAGKVQGRPRDESVTKQVVEISGGKLVWDVAKARPESLVLSGAVEALLDQSEVYRKPGAGENEEERRKVGEILVKSTRLEVSFKFE